MILQELILFLCLITSLRILFYQRDGSIFKWRYSLLAYLLVLLISLVGIAFVNGQDQLSPLLMVLIIFLAVGVFSCQGNVAMMVHLLTRRLT